MASLLRWLLGAAILGLPLPQAAAAPQGSANDYARAAELRQRFRGLVEHASLDARWLDATRLWYTGTSAEGEAELVILDAAARAEAPPSVKESDRAARTTLGATLVLEALGVEIDRIAALAAGRLHDEVRVLLEGGRAFSLRLSSGVAEAIDVDEVLAFQLPVETDRRVPGRSGRGGAATSIGVINRTRDPLELNWIETGGGRRSYGAIPPGGTRWMGSFANHAFALVGPDGTDRAWFRAGRQAAVAIIRDAGPMDESASEIRAEPRTATPSVAARPGTSPSGLYRAYIESGELCLQRTRSGEVHRIQRDPATNARFRGPLLWSSDGLFLVARSVEAGERRDVHIVDSAPDDQRQPRLVTLDYTKPGDRIERVQPRLFRLAAGEPAPLVEVPIQGTELFDNPWSIQRIEWDADGTRFTFLYNQRGHRVMRWIAVDAESGHASAIIEEAPESFFDYAGKLFLHRVEGTDEVLWMTERSGWNHIVVYDEKNAVPARALTRGKWLVRGVESVNDGERTALLRVQGRTPGEDPYHVHFARIDLDTGDLTPLTEGDGTHRIEWSPDGRWYIDRWSRIDHPPVWELRRSSDGGLVTELGRADAGPLEAAGWPTPQRFVAKGRDDKTDIHGVVYRPSNFDPKGSYPVIESIYAGPHGAHVPKSWTVHSKPRELAELGFIVVQIDGMGTNWRSKAFHDVAWKNLGDAGFPDRIAWLRALGAVEPAADLGRVGIYGGSAGGQNAMRALIAHGDFYSAAVADCGCHDNRMDKIWWNELWMSWPIGPHYSASSNVDQAHRLEGDLMLVVGELDRNVDPASTMQVVDALVRANKDFELLVLPGMGHGAAESTYGTRRRRDFFVRRLLGREPRWEQ